MFDRIGGRRQFAKVIGTVAGAAAVGATGAGAVLGVRHLREEEARKLRTVPWPYAPLDADQVATRAFAAYRKHHCMFGAFDALAGLSAERLGEPYASFPVEMMAYGAGGVNGWGTICGALNGAAAAFQLLSKEPGPLVDALFTYYEREPLPDLELRAAKFPSVQSVAGSPLCHASVSRWCEKAGKRSYAPEREERCGIVTASVARKAAELLNLQLAGKPLPVLPVAGTETGRCVKCHEEKGELENTRAKMDCRGCHFHLGGEHPEI